MKQAILVREDLKLPKGKMATQVSHASVEAVLNSKKSVVEEWKDEGMKKVVLKVKDEAELFNYQQIAKSEGLVASLIRDAGRTTVAPGTVTCLAIGPDDDSKIDKVSGKLKLM